MKYLLCLAAVVWLFSPMEVKAEAKFTASVSNVTVTLYNEPCSLKEVSNLPHRATWKEDGKTYEGCFGIVPQAGVLMMYFKEDRTVAVMPFDVFVPVTGA
jgi:hypothetical protein